MPEATNLAAMPAGTRAYSSRESKPPAGATHLGS
jgi:hypothetical protein